MARPDLNLLVTLDVLLSEGSVARAADRLGLSPSAMSRALARVREATGDPLLVRAGRSLVPTPRAIELRAEVGQVVEAAEAILRPLDRLDLGRLSRTFTIRASDGFVENFGPALIRRIGGDAPLVRLRFMHKVDKDSTPLRDGRVDLETGVVGKATGPEVRLQALYHDRFVACVRPGHPITQSALTAEKYAGARHVSVSRRGVEGGPIDDILADLGLIREVTTLVGGFSAALSLARASELVATVPERHTGNLREGLETLELPFASPQITVSMFWHPRLDADPAHKWLRACVREVCSSARA